MSQEAALGNSSSLDVQPSGDSQDETQSSSNDISSEGGEVANEIAADATYSDMSSSRSSSIYQGEQQQLGPAQSADEGCVSIEHFNSILRPATETSEPIDRHVSPSETLTVPPPPQEVLHPNALNAVLSFESPVLGHVDLNKGCFEVIQLHHNRNQQLERELDRLRKERQGLDAELLCRGSDIEYYKGVIQHLKEEEAQREGD
ncbi:hypothetical protein PG987_005319 [Apiospora arundinis]